MPDCLPCCLLDGACDEQFGSLQRCLQPRTFTCVRRSVKVLHFYEVVPVPTLLDVLSGDVPAVAQRVQRLVLPFYFSGAYHMP